MARGGSEFCQSHMFINLISGTDGKKARPKRH
jgi:hypothetical protein